jgi:mannonate dehydratase
MLARHGLKVAALENLSPNFWSDILLDGPKKHEQMDGLKQLVRDAGRAGVPVIGYNFSIAGVWGWQRKRVARGGATTAVFFGNEFDTDDPIPDGMLWNMRYRHPVAGAAPISVSERDLWSRLEWFLKELVPVAEKANVRLAAHPDDPPVERLRGNARLVNAHAKYQRLLDIAPSPANALEFCICSTATSTKRPAISRGWARSPTFISATSAARSRIMSRPSWMMAMSRWRKSFASCGTRALMG